jgi:hypothetical protein
MLCRYSLLNRMHVVMQQHMPERCKFSFEIWFER